MAKEIQLHVNDKIRELGELLEGLDYSEPDPEDVKAIRRYLAKHPGVAADVAGLGRIVSEGVIQNFSAPVGLEELIAAEWKDVQMLLGSDNATALEQLLIQHVATAWLRLQEAEFKHANAIQAGGEIKTLDYWDRRVNAAQRRFLRACTTLARIRKMELPTMQVNIGQQQVNQVNR